VADRNDASGTTSTTPHSDQRVLYSGTITAMGSDWMEVTPDVVAVGAPPARLVQRDPMSMCEYEWQAEDFEVGWPVLVSGALWTDLTGEQWLRIVPATSIEVASESLKADQGEMRPLSGDGRPAIVVGGPYGDATAVVLDSEARPLQYVRGSVTAQRLAPCPDSQLVVLAGTNIDASGVERYALEVLDTATGTTRPVAMPGVGPFDRDDGTYPWDVRCADAAATAIEVSTGQGPLGPSDDAPRRRDRPPTQPAAGRHGETVTFLDTAPPPRDTALPEGAAPLERGTLVFAWNARPAAPPGGQGWDDHDLRWYPRDGGAWRAVLPGIDAFAVARVADPALGPPVAYTKHWSEDENRIPREHLAAAISASNPSGFAGATTSLAVGAVGAVVVVGFAGVMVMRARRRRAT